MVKDNPFQAAKKAYVYLTSALSVAESYLQNPKGDDRKRDFSHELEAISQRQLELIQVHDFAEGPDHSAPAEALAVLAHAEWECTHVVVMSDVKRHTDLESTLISIRHDLRTAGAPQHRS